MNMISTQQEVVNQFPTQLEIDHLRFQFNNHINFKNQLEIDKKTYETEIEKIKDEVNLLSDVKVLLETLKNYKMDSKKEFILNTINMALNDVFEQDVRIDIEMNASNKSGASTISTRYDIVLYQNNIEISRNEKLLDNNGGGVLSFISILFKILVGYIYSNSKFYLFDESISQVSPRYRPRLAQFIRTFCETYEFTIVLISQTDDIDEYAHVGYKLDSRPTKTEVPELIIDQIFGVYPTENYNYVKIKNFQSIVDQEFRYKGFTVIRGDNNIGKSASFRAINAIVFNTFNVDDYPRINRPRGSIVEIEFGYYKDETTVEENNANRINLAYKNGQKLVYTFDGEEYAGKSLAFEKIKEKVETLGFKYVNLKETYKNFKGNLKDQTERLALTTQHDGFYLVGNKSNETEKVFNFLFDSSGVSNAILQATQDERILNDRFQILTSNINKINLQLKQHDILIQKFNLMIYILTIKKYFNDIQDRERINIRLIKLKENEEILNKLVHLYSNLDNYSKLKEERILIDQDINFVEKTIVMVNSCISLVEDITSLQTKIQNVYNYKTLLDNRSKGEVVINTIEEKIKLMNNYITNYEQLSNAVLYYKTKIVDIKKFIEYMNIRASSESNIQTLNNRIELLKVNIEKYEQLQNLVNSYKYYIDILKKYFDSAAIKDKINHHIYNLQLSVTKVSEIITSIESIERLKFNIDNFGKLLTTRLSIQANIDNTALAISQLPHEIGICLCQHCNGEGYTNV